MLQQHSLQEITVNVPVNSVITITNIVNDYIIFEVALVIGKHKKKQYKIKCQTPKKIQQVQQVLTFYSNRRAIVSQNYVEQLVDKFGRQINTRVIFSEIIAGISLREEELRKLACIRCENYRILGQLSPHQIQQLYFQFHKMHICGMFEVEFNLQVGSLHEQMLGLAIIIGNWSKLNKCDCNSSKLTIYYQESLFISLENKKMYGTQVCLHRNCNQINFILKILDYFINYQHFISLQFIDWKPQSLEIVSFILENYNHNSKYLIKLGNHLQITEHRFFINTIGMTKKQVAKMFQIMKHPGHYQLICHSSKEHFGQAINFFMSKPLIKFQFFVPLAQVDELRSPIQVMMEKASSLKKKVEIFMRMLKAPVDIGVSTILKAYLAISKTV